MRVPDADVRAGAAGGPGARRAAHQPTKRPQPCGAGGCCATETSSGSSHLLAASGCSLMQDAARRHACVMMSSCHASHPSPRHNQPIWPPAGAEAALGAAHVWGDAAAAGARLGPVLRHGLRRGRPGRYLDSRFRWFGAKHLLLQLLCTCRSPTHSTLCPMTGCVKFKSFCELQIFPLIIHVCCLRTLCGCCRATSYTASCSSCSTRSIPAPASSSLRAGSRRGTTLQASCSAAGCRQWHGTAGPLFVRCICTCPVR